MRTRILPAEEAILRCPATCSFPVYRNQIDPDVVPEGNAVSAEPRISVLLLSDLEHQEKQGLSIEAKKARRARLVPELKQIGRKTYYYHDFVKVVENRLP